MRVRGADRIAIQRGEGHRVVRDPIERQPNAASASCGRPWRSAARRWHTTCSRSTRANTVAGGFARQFPLELLERPFVVAARQMDRARAASAAPRRRTSRAPVRGQARGELPLRLVQGLAGDVDRRRQPVRERELGQERQRAMRRAEPFFAPADDASRK